MRKLEFASMNIVTNLRPNKGNRSVGGDGKKAM